jgi:hypothetical protein
MSGSLVQMKVDVAEGHFPVVFLHRAQDFSLPNMGKKPEKC